MTEGDSPSVKSSSMGRFPLQLHWNFFFANFDFVDEDLKQQQTLCHWIGNFRNLSWNRKGFLFRYSLWCKIVGNDDFLWFFFHFASWLTFSILTASKQCLRVLKEDLSCLSWNQVLCALGWSWRLWPRLLVPWKIMVMLYKKVCN